VGKTENGRALADSKPTIGVGLRVFLPITTHFQNTFSFEIFFPRQWREKKKKIVTHL